VAFPSIVLIVLIVLFLVWLFPKKDIASRRAIRTVCVEALGAYSGHVHMVLCARWQEQRVLVSCGRWRMDWQCTNRQGKTNPASV